MRRSVPETFESERLDIVCPAEEHAPGLHEAILESIEEMKPWMPWAKGDVTVEDCAENLRTAQAAYRSVQDFRLKLFLRETGEFVGGSGLHRIDWSVPRFEIGFWVRTSMTGHGYITEAVRRISEFALEDLGAQRVEIRMSTRNVRSRRVAERAGFPIESIMHNESRELDGSLRDTCVYAMIARDA
jgi:RimJ/RimL family protein N-acetyltransferase